MRLDIDKTFKQKYDLQDFFSNINKYFWKFKF